MSLMDKLKKNSTIKETAILSESKFFDEGDKVVTSVPAINVALTGELDGGFGSGLIVFAGPSKHFKTSFTLLMMKAYLDKHKDAIALFYDSEFGSPQSYFESFGIDLKRVLHTPVANIEELKFDIMKQLSEIKRGDKVFIALDSAGNIASKKEVDDALEGKSVADMTRAKSLKSLFRMITPELTIKQLPMVVVNHTYKEQGLYPKDIVSGGCLVEGTKIVTLGGLKEVQDIQRGDIVMTLDGEKMVTHSWNPETLAEGEPECYEIEFEDGYTVTVSNQHPFLTKTGWVDAEDLSVGDSVLKL
jgi:preprotein translocase subunit YajC